MFHPIPKWSVFVWNIFSVISIDHNKWQTIYSTLMLITCIFTIYITPYTVCVLDDSCDHSLSTLLKGMFSIVVSTIGFISRLAILFKGNTSLMKYKKNIDDFHTFTPMNTSEADWLKKLSSRIVLCSMLLVIPVNIMKLWIIWSALQNISLVLLNFILIYIQNFSMYCIETHFTVLCFIVYQKFIGINRDLMTLNINTNNKRYKYPFVSRNVEEKYSKINDYGTVEHNKDILMSLATGYSMANLIEKLKFKHKLGREAINNLNNMFGIHLGFSLCSLCSYAIFDLYYYILGMWNISNSMILVVGWILQYSIRFLIITALAQMTTNQVIL